MQEQEAEEMRKQIAALKEQHQTQKWVMMDYRYSKK